MRHLVSSVAPGHSPGWTNPNTEMAQASGPQGPQGQTQMLRVSVGSALMRPGTFRH